MHTQMVAQLLSDVENPGEEDVECLCVLLKTVGDKLDHDKARARMDTYIERMRTIRGLGVIPARIKFMIDDVLDMRSNRWTQRKLQQKSGPKTIMEIRLDADEDQIKANTNRRERQVGLQRIQRMREQMRMGQMGGGMGEQSPFLFVYLVFVGSSPSHSFFDFSPSCVFC